MKYFESFYTVTFVFWSLWLCAFRISSSQTPCFGRVACFFQPFVYHLKVLYLLQKALLCVVFHQTYDIWARFHPNISHTIGNFRQYLQLNFVICVVGAAKEMLRLESLENVHASGATMVLTTTYFAQLQSKRIWNFDCLLKSRFVLALFGNKRHWTNAKKLENTDYNLKKLSPASTLACSIRLKIRSTLLMSPILASAALYWLDSIHGKMPQVFDDSVDQQAICTGANLRQQLNIARSS